MRRYYTLEVLEYTYRSQEPNLSEKEVKKKAKNLHRQLNTMDVYWARSNRRFYAHNILQDFLQDFI